LLKLRFGAFKKIFFLVGTPFPAWPSKNIFPERGVQIMKNNSNLPNFNSDTFVLTPFTYLFHITKFTITNKWIKEGTLLNKHPVCNMYCRLPPYSTDCAK
jgi:hypothetical protein